MDLRSMHQEGAGAIRPPETTKPPEISGGLAHSWAGAALASCVPALLASLCIDPRILPQEPATVQQIPHLAGDLRQTTGRGGGQGAAGPLISAASPPGDGSAAGRVGGRAHSEDRRAPQRAGRRAAPPRPRPSRPSISPRALSGHCTRTSNERTAAMTRTRTQTTTRAGHLMESTRRPPIGTAPGAPIPPPRVSGFRSRPPPGRPAAR